MKLLPKSEILKQKAVVQQQTVEEGKKLAKTIDRLREVAAEEETSLEKFRSETLAQIHKETTEANSKLEVLKAEVKSLQEARQEAQKPLHEEKHAIEILMGNLKEKEAQIEAQCLSLVEEERALEEKKKDLAKTLLQLESREHQANTLLEKARVNETATTLALDEAKKAEDAAIKARQTIETELVHRERVCSDAENSIILRERNLAAQEAELLKGWRLLEDRKSLLERNIKRTSQ